MPCKVSGLEQLLSKAPLIKIWSLDITFLGNDCVAPVRGTKTIHCLHAMYNSTSHSTQYSQMAVPRASNAVCFHSQVIGLPTNSPIDPRFIRHSVTASTTSHIHRIHFPLQRQSIPIFPMRRNHFQPTEPSTLPCQNVKLAIFPSFTSHVVVIPSSASPATAPCLIASAGAGYLKFQNSVWVVPKSNQNVSSSG